MKAEKTGSFIPKKNMIGILVTTAVILIIPLIAMQFSDEVDWKLSDFLIMGTLLVGTGVAYELVAHKLGTNRNRVILGILLLMTMFLVWIELATGIFGTPFAGS